MISRFMLACGVLLAFGSPVVLAGWETKCGVNPGSDLLSDGANLYKVGGDWHANEIWVYDADEDEWTLLTDANPIGYGHKSPGENNRSHYYNGKIICNGTNWGSDKVTVYDIAGDSWSSYTLPAVEGYSWGQGGTLNGYSGEVYCGWTEDPSYPYVFAPLNVDTGTWGTVITDRYGRIGETLAMVNEDSSGTFVFDLAQADRYVRINIYDLTTQPADFSGSWYASSTYDLGEGQDFRNGNSAGSYGCDAMAWDPAGEKLYVVGPFSGITLAYDPATDSWEELETLTGVTWGWRDEHAAVADGWLYLGTYAGLYAMQIPEPATMGLLVLGAIGLASRRRRVT